MTFDRFIIIRNPISTDAHRAARRILDLRKLYPTSELIVIDTVRGGRPPNIALLKKYSEKLGPGTLLCVAGGDGTVNMILDILLQDPSLPDMARLTPILPLWGGNANDLAYMLNGAPSRNILKTLFERGKVIRIHPMVCTLQNKNGIQVHVAACYASFGASGFAMQELERIIRSRSPMRQPAVTRFGQELVEVSRILLRAPTFTVSESDKKRIIFERIFLNGSRFAKVAGVPLRLTDPRFRRTTAERKSVLTLLLRIVELRSGRHMALTHDSFIVHETIWAQFDGEVVSVPPDTQVTISILERPFFALSTRLS